MKRIFVLNLLILVCGHFMAQDTYTKTLLVSEIDQVQAPYVVSDFIIFTAEDSARHVGIAFDFEGFKTIHSFEKLVTRDLDDNVTSSLFFYILEVPKDISSVAYRLIIDGLWTVDPMNEKKILDRDSNIMMSRVDMYREEIPATSIPQENYVRFVYQGKPGQQIRLGGTFTNWDSSIYKLKETSPGFYELQLFLPKGTYYYAYYNGIASFVDPTNPERAYTTDGKMASVIIVE